jgi:hypothetical protein
MKSIKEVKDEDMKEIIPRWISYGFSAKNTLLQR